MFKGILPKRIASSDFTMVTTLAEPPATAPNKENMPGVSKQPRAPSGKGIIQSRKRADTKSSKDRPQIAEKPSVIEESMEVAFDKLLEDLQIPSTLRPRLIGMESTVKAAMLKSSQTMALAPLPLASQDTAPLTPRSTALRRTRSTESFDSPRRASKSSFEYEPPRAPALFGESARSGSASSVGPAASPSRKSSATHGRGTSFDASRLLSRSQVHLPVSASVVDLTGKASKERGAAAKEKAAKDISPMRFFSILSGTSTTQLDIENVKKLRLMLRNESASWSEEFLKLGGYAALLTRLNEILEVEWREEQHDDQVLHELLRCFKALSTSSIGCFALRSSCPTPFVQLVALLFSDKKPGDVATRQLMVDLLLILFELYPASSLPALGTRPFPRREAWETASTAPVTSNLITLPAPHKNFYSLIRALLLTPAPPPSESPAAPISPHAFIESLHKPRIYKTYLQELSDVCRDYFWVFCHPNNTIWILSETDEGRVEKPRAPGGMTGGVEFEAMSYFTTHLKLINAIAKTAAELNLPKEHDHSAYRFHADLFLSGFERIILISRKASTTYYPTLHLELARYVAHCGRANYELPWPVSRLVGVPPAALAKNASGAPSASGRSTPGPGAGDGARRPRARGDEARRRRRGRRLSVGEWDHQCCHRRAK
ncbi:Drf-GBD domain-containing protein [Mycena sanguinolenta]|uniref:Drf-GBD domain-containing protein n=1 Tax=Mycena sanguinolenta TaxID=230812 RepID=A0A8H6ZBZ8_9AGAR|nr:Drf-GBD domain-containing protein [Mycena sanguinolenta]